MNAFKHLLSNSPFDQSYFHFFMLYKTEEIFNKKSSTIVAVAYFIGMLLINVITLQKNGENQYEKGTEKSVSNRHDYWRNYNYCWNNKYSLCFVFQVVEMIKTPLKTYNKMDRIQKKREREYQYKDIPQEVNIFFLMKKI